jgi:uncharacterized membrane protein
MSAGIRRPYLDWLRGVAVLIMIEAHLLDSWTGVPDRHTREFGWAVILGGMGAPLFLFLAGVSVPLAGASRLRRTGDVPAASASIVRRGAEVFGLAFLFRIQAWILGWSSPRALLTVDILNIMGPSISAAGLLWGASRLIRGRLLSFVFATAAIAFSTPLVRAAPIGALPDPLEAYIRPDVGLSNFVFFPWSAFVFVGAIVGVILEAAPREREGTANAWLFAAGTAVTVAALAASYLPSPYPDSSFWTTSPSFFFLRAGLITTLVGAAYGWQQRPRALERWSPLQQLGRSSFFIYWIHVEMVYGLISLPLHEALTLRQALAALAAFATFMLLCSLAKDKVVERWRARSRSLL